MFFEGVEYDDLETLKAGCMVSQVPESAIYFIEDGKKVSASG